MMKRTCLITALLLTVLSVGCKGNASVARNTDKIAVEANDVAEKFTAKYIEQRITAIFTEAFNEDTHDLLALDHKYMSKEYNELQDKSIAIGERDESLVIDANHWVQGQEWTYPTIKFDKVENITEKTATAYVTITSHMPGMKETDTNLILPLVFENGDWFIDNMQQYYEGELLDEKAWYKKYVENDGKIVD